MTWNTLELTVCDHCYFCCCYSTTQCSISQCLTYLVHCDCSLDPCCHGINPSAHSQVVHRLVLLSDGVLRMDPGHFHIPLLDSLKTQSCILKITGSKRHQWDLLMSDMLLTFLTLVFSVFSSFADFLAFLSRSLAASFKLNRCSKL